MTSRTRILANLLLSLPLAAGLLCAATHASAQTSASVNIPFAFSADNQYVPAGSYQLQWLSDRFLALRNTRTNTNQVLMVRPEAGSVIETRGRLVFQRAGKRNYLVQVWAAGTSMHSEMVVRHKTECEEVKAPAPAGSTFELALK